MSFVINPYSVLFTPNRLANLVMWLDAADSNSVTTVSSAVSQWTDKSGNGNNATQSTAGARPTYTTAGLNGLNVLTFNGSNNGHILTTTYNLANTHTIVTVCKKTTQTSVSASILRPAVAATTVGSPLNTGLTGIGTFREGPASPNIDVLDMFMESTRVPVVEDSWLDNEILIASSTYNGSVLSAWKNGDVHSSPLSITRTGFGTVNIGGTVDDSVRRFAGTIAEVIIMSTSAATADREKIEGYLAHKWGLTANLPAGHPYKTSAP